MKNWNVGDLVKKGLRSTDGVKFCSLKAEVGANKKKRSKYNSIKTVIDDIEFDSRKEAEYYQELLIAKKANDSKDRVVKIELQVPFVFMHNGISICKYVLDFRVTYDDGRLEFVDVKGYRKGPAYATYRIKKKLMKAFFNIDIKEI